MTNLLTELTELMQSPEGGYAFLPASATYSSGAMANAGFGLSHVVFRQPVPLADGFEAMRDYLAVTGRPMAAVCGIELRIAQPLTFDGFGQFNKRYIALLQQHGLHIDGKAPAVRTNVAPLPSAIAPAEPAIYAFTHTIRMSTERPNYIIAGQGEVGKAPEGRPPHEGILRLGDTSPEAMREKAAFCVAAANDIMRRLGVSWADASATNIYTAHAYHTFLEAAVLNVMGASAIHGVHWHYSRPPIESLEFEIDARNVAQEIMLG